VSIFIIGLYVLFWSTLGALPFLDYPNHLARCYVISKLLSEPTSHLHQFFSFDFSFTPYILGDVLLSSLILCTSLNFAAVLWPVVCFLSLPLALTFYLRQIRFEREEMTLAQLFTLYLSSNWFFLMGFFNYQLGISLVFIALGFWERVGANLSAAQSEAANGGFRYFNYCLFRTSRHFGLLDALSSFIFSLRDSCGQCRLLHVEKRAICNGSPPKLNAFNIIRRNSCPENDWTLTGFGSGMGAMTFRSPLWKLTSVGIMFLRFDDTIDIILFFVFIILVMGPVSYE